MLEEAHKALETMSAACMAMKVDEWDEAERKLRQVHNVVAHLLSEVADKNRQAMTAPGSDRGDRR